MDLHHVKATYKPMEDTGVPAVRIDIPINKSHEGGAAQEFLGGIIDANPHLKVIYDGDNNNHLSYRVELKGPGNPKDVEKIKEEVLKTINEYKNASPEEQHRIMENGVKHFQWFDKNNGFKIEMSDVDAIKKDIHDMGLNPKIKQTGFKPPL